MSEIVERHLIDLRYEQFRVQNPTREKRLFVSIESSGIQVPLEVIQEQHQGCIILLDGFKRHRIAKKLGIAQIPVSIIGSSEVEGLLRIIRHNDKSSLSGFEEACFIEQLHTAYHLSITEIARRVERSVAWVRLRIDMLKHMSESIREKILSGAFPLRSYLYELGPVTRVRGKQPHVEAFVDAVSGRDYSTRDIATLSRAFFSGDELVREQITQGNVDWTLRMLQDKADAQGSAADSPQQKLEKHLHSCLWHFNRLLPTLQSEAKTTWLSQPSIQEPLTRLRSRCSLLLKL
jgi:ParB/RepB/Spo0J family partition protein